MRIAVTRSKEQLYELASRATVMNIEIVALPLMEVHPISFAWPDDIDLARVGWVFFTSANGVEYFFQRLDSIGCKLPKSAKIAVVGRQTEAALVKRGFEAAFQPSEAYGRLLFSEFVERHPPCNQTLVYARAKDIDWDPATLFASRKMDYRPVVCYESVEKPIDPHSVTRIKRDDMILFTAPSMVRAFHKQFGDPEARLLAIGSTTAAEMERHRWVNYRVLEQADVNSVLEYV